MELSFKEFTDSAGLIANPTYSSVVAFFNPTDPEDTDPESVFLTEAWDGSELTIWTILEDQGKVYALQDFITESDTRIGHFIAANYLDDVDVVRIDTYESCSSCGGSEDGCDDCEDGNIYANLNPGWQSFKP